MTFTGTGKSTAPRRLGAVRESRPADYLKIVAMIVSKCEDLSLDSEMRDAAVEQFIEERRQQALAMIAKMDEADDA
jgi:hypothetical protein